MVRRETMWRGLCASAAILSVSACATSTAMYAPDGKEMLAISCHGSAVSPSACFEKAGGICGAKGYDILASDGSATPISSGYAQVNRYNGLAVQQSGMMVLRTLYVRCNVMTH